jgi:hypothetical protein
MGPYGIPGSATYAVPINDLGGMLNVLPDNTANQINAQNVRDVVSGLWDKYEYLNATVSNLQVLFTAATPSTVTVGGLAQGNTFTAETIQSILWRMLYPYTAPLLNIAAFPNLLEFGNTQSVFLRWSITARMNDIFTSEILRPLQTPVLTATPLANTIAANVLSGNQPIADTLTIFTFSVSDFRLADGSGGDNLATASVAWTSKRYWGTVPIGHPLSAVSSATISYSNISSLSNELNSSYIMTKTIAANNSWVVFIWPSSNAVDLTALPVSVQIDGMSNNDWTKTRSNIPLENQYGYVTNYDVWRFNYLQSNTFEYQIS